MKTIFITGCNGNIGSRILVEFLENSDSKIKVLIREKTQEDAQKELEKILKFWEIYENKYLNRIEVIKGDILEKNLGIKEEIYKNLVKEVNQVIHCAAILKLNLSINEAREIIFGGTKEVIKIAKECMKNTEFERFHYISTMEITGNLSGTIKEEFLTNYNQKFLNTYEQAKFETEEYLRKLHEEINFPITIYRPSMVVGDSKNGKIINPQSFYHLTEELLLKQSPFIPGTKNFRIDVIPLDIIAKSIFISHNSNESNGQIYHLTNGTEKTTFLPDFLKIAQETYLKIDEKNRKIPKFISPKIIFCFLKILKPISFGSIKKKIKINEIFIKFFFLNVTFDNSNLKKMLKKENIEMPELKDYIFNLYKYYENTKNSK